MPTMRNHPYIEVGKLYRIDRNDIHAFAESPDGEHFVLMAGSVVKKPLFMPFALPLYHNADALEDIGGYYLLTRDVPYSNPTLCAAAVLGYRAPGSHNWRPGTTLSRED